jgi:zinc protease
MKFAAALLLVASAGSAQMRVTALPGKSPLVTFRIVFTTGSAADPAGKPGLAYLTASMLASSGSRDMTYRQITDALFPMAASVNVTVDKEMCAFYGTTHVDNLDAYYQILRAMLLEPGWREDDFKRVKDDAINNLRVGLRSNDEELAKEVLYRNIYAGTPYEHYAGGTVSSLQAMTLDDVRGFYKSQYSQSQLILGLAGGYTPAFLERVKHDFRALPEGPGFRPRMQAPSPIQTDRAVIVDKDTRSVAYSIGFPISVTRESPAYPALLLAASYLGQHRMSSGLLYQEMREKRGLNYGDYAYVEYFPRGMYLFEPQPNLARHYQIFQLWIRPVEPPTAKFALRLALFELDRLIQEGIPEDGFARTRDFLIKYLNVLTRTQSANLGYAIDAMYYDRPNFTAELKAALAKLTRDDINRAIRAHLRTDRLVVTAVTRDGEGLKQQLASPDPSPIKYNSPKPAGILEEDKTVEKRPLGLTAADITVVPVASVFQ